MSELQKYLLAMDGSFGCSSRYWDRFKDQSPDWRVGFASSLLDEAIRLVGKDLLNRLAESDELLRKATDRVEKAEAALERKGYRKSCDISACNCGDQWTHGGHAEQRLYELREAFEQAGIDLNGKTLLTALCSVLGDREKA